MGSLTENLVETTAIKVKAGHGQASIEQVAAEKALTVYLNNKECMTLVCSLGQEQELVTGMLLSEGMVSQAAEISRFVFDPVDGLVWVQTNGTSKTGEELFLKRYITSCCGKGRSSLYFANDAQLVKPVTSSLYIRAQEVGLYMELLEQQSELFHLTGGVHGGAVVGQGELFFYTFDIGRHNVLDKIYGHAAMEDLDLSQKVIAFSGRMSSEIVIKIAKMGCPIVIGISAPTDLALDLARELGITIIGFARNHQFNIYTHEERVLL